MGYEREREVAVLAVTRAAWLCQAVRAEIVGVASLAKADESPVTLADFGAQALVCRDLQEAFPGAAIVAEEDARELAKPDHAATLEHVLAYVRRFHPEAAAETVCGWIDAGNGNVGERFWTLDPIDGTKGFLRNDQYAVALALVERGAVRLAALACPALPVDPDDAAGPVGVVFVAVRGEGAALAPLGSPAFRPLARGAAVGGARLRFVESVEADHGDAAAQAAVAQAVGIVEPSLRMDSQVKYGVVARGDAALYLRLPSPRHPGYREKIWDHAAGALLVEETGGRVTDMNGRPLDFTSSALMDANRGVVASRGGLHDAALAALARHLESGPGS
jgi:3'(2'), 5'-bisphosphate nucleotidase